MLVNPELIVDLAVENLFHISGTTSVVVDLEVYRPVKRRLFCEIEKPVKAEMCLAPNPLA